MGAANEGRLLALSRLQDAPLEVLREHLTQMLCSARTVASAVPSGLQHVGEEHTLSKQPAAPGLFVDRGVKLFCPRNRELVLVVSKYLSADDMCIVYSLN